MYEHSYTKYSYYLHILIWFFKLFKEVWLNTVPSVWAKRKLWGSYQTLSTKYFDVIKNIIDASGEAWKVTFEWEWGKYSRNNMSTAEYSTPYWLYWTNTIYLILFSPVWKTKRTRSCVVVKRTHTSMGQDIGQSLSVANRDITQLKK